MSDRTDRIELHKRLGLPFDWLTALTDDEYEAQVAFAEEKHVSETEGMSSGPLFSNGPRAFNRR